MKLSPDEFEDTVEVARNYLQDGCADAELIARDFAETLVALADCCLVGVRCERHGAAIHGQEAEELRAGVEQILNNTSDVGDDDAPEVLQAQRKALLFLLDRIDARDSLAFLEATKSPDADATDTAT